MNQCMLRFATPEMRDAARREWFETGAERAEEKREKEERRRRDEVFWREWWDKEKGTQGDEEEGGVRGWRVDRYLIFGWTKGWEG